LRGFAATSNPVAALEIVLEEDDLLYPIDATSVNQVDVHERNH
jgi:hypothetical protein